MKLKQIGAPYFVMICAGCGKRVGYYEKKFADLDGKAFVDWYCEGCAQELRAKKMREVEK